MILYCRDIEVVSQTSSRVTPAEKDGRKSERQKASGNRRVYNLVTFILIMQTYDHLKEVERFVREINGVESIKGDSTSNKLEVKGKVDPKKVRKIVKRNTKREVKLILPSAESESHRDENKRPDEKLEEKARPDDIANTKSEENVTVLKIKLCCDSCNQKLKRFLKDKGLETVAVDKDEDLVTVKGTVNMTELKSSVKGELKKDIEVVIPAKKDTVATNKDTETGAINNDDKDNGPTDKKGKEVGAAETTIREKETVLGDKKREGKGKGKGKIAGAMDKKGKAVDAADKDSEHKGNAGVPNNSENKDSGVNQRKDRCSGHRRNEETSSDGSRRGNGQEDVISVPMKVSPPYYQRSVDYVYEYSSRDRYRHRRPVNYSNGYDMFSDENPHSCTIL